jgi:hypothetical protein
LRQNELDMFNDIIAEINMLEKYDDKIVNTMIFLTYKRIAIIDILSISFVYVLFHTLIYFYFGV